MQGVHGFRVVGELGRGRPVGLRGRARPHRPATCGGQTRRPRLAVRRCSDASPLPVVATSGGKEYVLSEEGLEYEVGSPWPWGGERA